MTLGKKERMAAVIVGIVAVAAAIHFLVFQQKARNYDQTKQDYNAAVQTLSTAEFIRDQQAFEEYNRRTGEYSELVTTVVAELNLERPVAASATSPGAVDRWASQTIELLSQLNAQRQGQVRLTFLDQNGWNLPAQLPSVGGMGAIPDRVSQLNYVFQQLQYTAGNPMTEAQVRAQYNTHLQALGINPQETSRFYYQPYNLFFNNEDWITNLMSQSRSGGMGSGNNPLQSYYNIWGLQRFGPAVPALKKIWMYALISQEMQEQNIDPNMMSLFGEALEVGIPLGEVEPLNSINKQLRALLDIIDIAGRTGVQEISQVKFLRPVNVPKATLMVAGETPPAEATPSPTPVGGMGMMDFDMMMMEGMGMMMGAGPGESSALASVTPVPDEEAVGTGAGVELAIRADNASLTRFYFELSHVTRTYGIDDLYIYNSQQGLLTTATIEVITDVKLDGGAGSEAAPVEGEVP